MILGDEHATATHNTAFFLYHVNLSRRVLHLSFHGLVVHAVCILQMNTNIKVQHIVQNGNYGISYAQEMSLRYNNTLEKNTRLI